MDLNTKYGKARIDKKGYYRIITSKEGNGGKQVPKKLKKRGRQHSELFG